MILKMGLMKKNILQSSFLMLLVFWQFSVACIKLILVLSSVKPDDTIFHQIIYKQIGLCIYELNIIRRSSILKETPAKNVSKEISFISEKYNSYIPKNKVLYVHPLPAPTDPMSTNSSAQNEANNKPRKGPIIVAVCRHPRVGKRENIIN